MSMHTNLSPAVYRALMQITSVLGSSFSLKQLTSYVQSWRQKTLRIEPDSMPPGMTGYCVPLRDLDLVCFRVDLDAVLQQISVLHELAHLLLGHIEPLPLGEATPTYTLFVDRRDHESMATYRKRFYDTLYNAEREQDAESLATLLMEIIQRYDSDLPDHLRNMHG